MFVDSIALVALSALTLVSAQSTSNSTFTIDPTSVTDVDKSTWCGAQTDSCSTLCGTPLINNCDTTSLNFECECVGGNFPDMNKFMNTVPWFVCERLQDNCIVANENNAAGQKNCTATYKSKCGTESPNDHQGEGASSGTSSSSTAPSSTAGPQSTSAPTSSVSKGVAAAPTAHIQHLGNGAAAVALGLLAYAL
ncbi:hypothetical protein F5Y19DRAFT_307570 [Xylariaceae sp. FL1651]|nr:hypothetical protein F5Y19DRAFT_307570 [Xylariaceae sp. FL1651]